MNEKDVSLLIIGFDPYKDVWDHYFYLLNKYWKNRPKTYLVTNEIVPEYKNVEVINTSNKAEWSTKVQKALEIIKSKYVILLLEDFFTTKNVNTDILLDLIQCMNDNNIKYCKILEQSKIKGKPFKNNKHLHVINTDEKYGISLQPAIWDRNFLKERVGNGNYNAWIFELNQVSNPIQNKERVDCIADDRNILQITHAIVQSKYLRKAVKVFKKQNYIINNGKRPVMSYTEHLKYKLKKVFSKYSPSFLKPLFKRIGKLMKVDFVSDRELGGKK